jgi:hypothetical protein
VFAVPYPAVSEVVDRYSSELDGRIVVDITNTVDFSTFQPLVIDAGSAAQEIADASAPATQTLSRGAPSCARTAILGQQSTAFAGATCLIDLTWERTECHEGGPPAVARSGVSSRERVRRRPVFMLHAGLDLSRRRLDF